MNSSFQPKINTCTEELKHKKLCKEILSLLILMISLKCDEDYIELKQDCPA